MHRRIVSFALFLVLAALLPGCRTPGKAPEPPPVACLPPYTLAPEDEQFLDDLQRRIFDYFWNEVYPETGIAIDHTDRRDGKVAATGFELAAVCIGVERGWITREQGYERALRILNAFWDDPADPDDGYVEGQFGLYWHYVDGRTGRMLPFDCVAPCDSADFIAGVVLAGEFFQGTEVADLAKKIYDNVQWDQFVAKRPDGSPDLMSFGWVPLHVSKEYYETDGLLNFNMSGFADNSLLIYALALGSDTHPIPQVTWERYVDSYTLGEYSGYECVLAGALFCRQVPQSFIPFSRLRDRKIDYWLDTVNAILADRAFNMRVNGYPPTLWGLNDCFGKESYSHAAPPGPVANDGTVATTSILGALPHVPALSMDAARYVRAEFGDRVYGKYGFTSSVNPQNNFVSPLYVGIELGPMIMLIENARSGLIWDLFARSSVMSNFVRRAGMSGVVDDFELPPEAPPYAVWEARGATPVIGRDDPQHGKLCLELKTAAPAVVLTGTLTSNRLLDFHFGKHLSIWTRDLRVLKCEAGVDGRFVAAAAAGTAAGSGWVHWLFEMPASARELCAVRIEAEPAGPRPALDNLTLEAAKDILPPHAISRIEARTGRAGGTIELSWTVPADPEGDGISKYILTATPTAAPGEARIIELLPISFANEAETQAVLLEGGREYELTLAAVDKFGHLAPASAPVRATANPAPVQSVMYDFEDGSLAGWENGDTNWTFKVTDGPDGGKCLSVEFTKTHGWNFVTFKVDPERLALYRWVTMRVKGRVNLLGKLWCSEELQQDMNPQSAYTDSEWTVLKFDTRIADKIVPGRDRVEKILLFVEPGRWSGSGSFRVDDVKYSGK